MGFDDDVDKWIKKTVDNEDKFVRQFAQELCFQVVVNTPVKTGFLKNSWQPYLNTEGSAQDGFAAPDPGGQMALDRLALVVSTMKAGDVLYYVNHAEYGPFVEFGTVHQAPQAFVRGVIARADTIAQGVANKILTGGFSSGG